ncbi:MAG: PQQ-dependent sugar dehydrogenase [Planctomycetota bacterium]
MRLPLASLLLLTGALAAPLAAQTPLTTELVASGLNRPVWIGQAPGDNTRLYVLEQHQADIEIVNLPSGTMNVTPFLDLTGTVLTNANERGLLGMAFDPDFQINGHFYVNYTRSGDGATIVARYTATSATSANPGSALTILGPIAQPQSNHNGGGIKFGPDGKLYIATGDGGNANDAGTGHIEPGGNAQNGTTLLGKMLRINSDGSIPLDNPFVTDPNVHDAIWATGLRNPWRFSFDRLTGDLYIGDVGQNSREEINVVAGTSTGGENYGWRCMEGANCTGFTGCVCNAPSLTLPVRTYGHANGNCSVTGGYVYRGNAIPDLQGTYFQADYCSARIWSFDWLGGTVIGNLIERTTELDPAGALAISLITTFGEDNDGEMYIADQNGEIFKLVPGNAFTGLGSALAGTSGEPQLVGEGTLLGGSAGALRLSNAAPSALSYLFLSFVIGGAPFKGGVLVPVPIAATYPIGTSPTGQIDLTWASWTPGLPSNALLVFQYAIQDAGAPFGVALSNALVGVTP